MAVSIKDISSSKAFFDKVILVGNPNVGKSVIFSLLTGQYATVSNYPGTTVEVAYGQTKLFSHRVTVIDTPGVNSLLPMSEDEKVTRDILVKENSHLVVQVADVKNLRRTLLVSLQLIELGKFLVLNTNMMDEASILGISIDIEKLSKILGIEVVPTIAVQKVGLDRLQRSLHTPQKSSFSVVYDSAIEQAVEKIERLLGHQNVSSRGLALMLLSGDLTLKDWLLETLGSEKLFQIEKIKNELQKRYSQNLGVVIGRQRAKSVEEILKQVYVSGEAKKRRLAAFLGNLSMHWLLGLPVLLLVLFGMYELVGIFAAGTAVDFLEGTIFGKYLNPAAKWVFDFIPVKFIQDLFVGEYGVISMGLTYALAIVLPVVGFFFLAFGILEDSGYLPRLAIMVNKIFNFMGLNGKAVLPMILGLGCDTMATLTTRVLDTKKERIIVTLLLALGVPCSAQLGVTLGLLGSLSFWATLIWAGVVLFVLITVGFLSSLIIRGRSSDFILEIPPIRVPKLSNIMVKTLARLEWYLKEAVPLFVVGTLLLFILDRVEFLQVLRKLAAPLVVGVLNLPSQATEAFIIGFLRRDYGAAGFFMLAEKGLLDPIQIVVSLVTITLFIPCIANFFIMIKERGWKTALIMAAFIVPFAFMVGGVLNLILRALKVNL